MSRTSTIALAVTTLAAAAALAACSSGSDAGGSSTPATTTATTPATTTTVTTAAAGGSSTAAASDDTSSNSDDGSGSDGGSSSGTTQCAESQLRAGAAALDIGVPRHVVRLTFKNKSDRSCTLTGFPGAAIVDSSGKQVQQAKRVVGGVVGGTAERDAPVTVKPGNTVFAFLEGASTKETGAAQAGCDESKYPRILVTPPNTKIAVPFTVGWPQCYGFNVHPVRSQ